MGFFDRLLGRTPEMGSKNVAKERLQVVLTSDRTNITPALLQMLKDEIVLGISKHVVIDQEAMEVTVTQGRQYHRIVADIPVLRMREAAPETRPRRRATTAGKSVTSGPVGEQGPP